MLCVRVPVRFARPRREHTCDAVLSLHRMWDAGFEHIWVTTRAIGLREGGKPAIIVCAWGCTGFDGEWSGHVWQAGAL